VHLYLPDWVVEEVLLRDQELIRHVRLAERLADDRLDGLRVAVGDVELVRLDVVGRLDLVDARVVVPVRRPVDVGDRLGDVEDEEQVLLEHRADLVLLIRIGELAAVARVTAGGARVHLRRPADHAVVEVLVVDRVAVGLVEVR